MKEIRIRLNDQDYLITATGEKSIMHTALEAGIKLIHSCLKGQCGSCRAYLMSSDVEMKNNFSLFEDEINAGQILLCQSYPLTDAVTVNPIRKPKA